MNTIDRRLSLLEKRIVEAEGLIRSLHQENARLREALAHRAEAPAERADGEQTKRSYRLVALEAERDEVRSRLRTLLEAL